MTATVTTVTAVVTALAVTAVVTALCAAARGVFTITIRIARPRKERP